MADGVALWFDTVAYDAADLRTLAGATLLGAGQVLPKAGRRPGAGLEVTVGGSPESVTVQPGCGVIGDGTTTAYPFAVASAATVALATRPSTGQSRIDLVIARVYDADVHGDTALREVDVEVVAGTASSGTPTPPTQPSGSLLLATLTVPDSGAVAVAVNGPRAVAAGGLLPVASSAERDNLSSYAGLAIYREDKDWVEVYDGSAWKVIAPSDTGWTTIPLSSGFASNTITPAYRVVGGVAYLRGDVKPTSGSFTGPGTIAITAAGAVPGPSVGSTFPVAGNASTDTGPALRLNVTGDGTLTLFVASASQGYVSLAGVSYPVD